MPPQDSISNHVSWPAALASGAESSHNHIINVLYARMLQRTAMSHNPRKENPGRATLMGTCSSEHCIASAQPWHLSIWDVWPTFGSASSGCCLDCSVCSGPCREPSKDAAPEGADGPPDSALELAAPAEPGPSQNAVWLCATYLQFRMLSWRQTAPLRALLSLSLEQSSELTCILCSLPSYRGKHKPPSGLAQQALHAMATWVSAQAVCTKMGTSNAALQGEAGIPQDWLCVVGRAAAPHAELGCLSIRQPAEL